MTARRDIANLKERHKKTCIVADRTIEAIRCEGAARRAIANLKERHKMPKIERLKRFGLMTARRDIANLKERHKKTCIVADRTIEAIRCEGAARCIKRTKTTYRANILYR